VPIWLSRIENSALAEVQGPGKDYSPPHMGYVNTTRVYRSWPNAL